MARETILKVLMEQSEFLIDFDRFSSDNYAAVFAGTSNANHKSRDCRFSIEQDS